MMDVRIKAAVGKPNIHNTHYFGELQMAGVRRHLGDATYGDVAFVGDVEI
jgi:hypothetical protein